MKAPLILFLLALAGSAAFAADAGSPAQTPPPTPPGVKVMPPNSSVSVSVAAGSAPSAEVSGKATITIDVGGKKVTREVDLGKALQIKIGDGSTAKADSWKAKGPSELRTWLGVATDEPSDEVRAQLPVANGTGLLVREVIADSPAAKGGLQNNDILVRFDDQILTNPDQLRALVGLKKEGDTVRLTYLRKGQEASVEVTLVARAETLTLRGGTLLLLSKVLEKSAGANGVDPAAPLVIQRNATLDNNGNLIFTGPAAGKEDAASGEQWHLFVNGAHADVTEAMKQLEKTLHDAGASDEVVAKTRQAIAEALAQMQKTVGEAGAPKDEIQRNARKALEEVQHAIEQAWRAEEGAASKIEPR